MIHDSDGLDALVSDGQTCLDRSAECLESTMNPEELMRMAINAAQRGIAAGQTPFGCAIAYKDRVLSACHNTVWLTIDSTAHAEVNAIRAACQAQQQILLEGCQVATTCEPCPMCMSALHWARVDEVYFGATIDDARQAGFSELTIPAAEVVRQGSSTVKLVPDVLTGECQALFAQWKSDPASRSY